MKTSTLLAAALAALALSACGASENAFSSSGSNVKAATGQLVVALTDAPNPQLKSIVVTISAIEADSDQAGWVTLSTGSQTVDLLSLKDRSTLLGQATLPAGTVSQLRLVLADGPQYVVLTDGTQLPLKTPSGQQSGLKIDGPFAIDACRTRTVTLDFDGERSIVAHPAEGGSSWVLRPVVRVKAQSIQGSCLADAGTEPKTGTDAGVPEPAVTTLTVPATSDIFAAGLSQTVPLGCADPTDSGGETLPPSVPVTGGSVVTFPSVSGGLKCVPYVNFNQADGPCFSDLSTDLQPVGAISGIVDTLNNMFLVGVFTGGSTPVSGPPPALDFSSTGIGQDFTSLAPALNQLFFVGDGHTSTGTLQRFVAPAGATTLSLGFADGYRFSGAAGCYGDNSGSLTVTASVE